MTTTRCETFEELISAALDGEAYPAEQQRLDQHLQSCAACRNHHRLAADLHRRTRLRPSPIIPDLSESILAQAASPSTNYTSTRRPIARNRGKGQKRAAGWGQRMNSTVAAAVVLVVAMSLGIAPSFSGTTSGPNLQAVDAVVTAADVGAPASVYLTLVNYDNSTDRLVGGQLPGVGALSFQVPGHSAGSDPVGYRVAAQAMTLLRPGSGHLTIERAPPGLDPGQTVELELMFERSDPVRIVVPVVAPQEVDTRITPA